MPHACPPGPSGLQVFCTICPIIAPIAVVYFAVNYIVWWVLVAPPTRQHAGSVARRHMRTSALALHVLAAVRLQRLRIQKKPRQPGARGWHRATCPACLAACRKYQHVYVYQGAYQSGGLVRLLQGSRLRRPAGARAAA